MNTTFETRPHGHGFVTFMRDQHGKVAGVVGVGSTAYDALIDCKVNNRRPEKITKEDRLRSAMVILALYCARV